MKALCQVTRRRTNRLVIVGFGPRSRPGSIGRLLGQQLRKRFEQVAARDDSDYAAGTDHGEGADSLDDGATVRRRGAVFG